MGGESVEPKSTTYPNFKFLEVLRRMSLCKLMETEPAGKKKGNVVSLGTTAPGLIKDGRVSLGTWKSPAKTVSVGTGVRQPKFFLSFQDLGSCKIKTLGIRWTWSTTTTTPTCQWPETRTPTSAGSSSKSRKRL